MKLVSIVIPVYNSTNSLRLITERVLQTFENIDFDYEIVFVDDKSPNPESWNTLTKEADTNTKIKIIQLTRNFGQQSATLCGLKHAKGDFIVTMDDDLQHRPEDIPSLLSESEHDIVIGTFKNKKHNFFKKLTSRIKGYFDYLLIGKPKDIQLSPFRMFNRIVADGILDIKTAYPFIPALMFYVSKDIVSVDVTHEKRYEGKTNYSLYKMIKVFSNLIISNSSFMLKAIGNIGIIISAISFISAFIIFFRKIFFGIEVIGWASTIVVLLFLGGLILFTLGVIGEYLIRIIVGVEHKPTYIIRKKKNF